MGAPCWLTVVILCVSGACLEFSFARAKTITEATISCADKTRKCSPNETIADPPKILFYSEWSPWTICDGHCERTRQRRCVDPKQCGSIVLKETDFCPLHGDKRNRRKCQRSQSRRKHRHKTDEFHVVRLAYRVPNTTQKSQPSPKVGKVSLKPKHSRKPPTNSRRANHPVSPYVQHQRWHQAYSQWYQTRTAGRYYQTTQYPFVYPSGYFGWTNHVQPPSEQRESSVIFPSAGISVNGKRPSGGRLSTYESKLYGKWSRWSQCSRSCTTHRRRVCKRKEFCGNTMLKESAYCYVEDSYCQRWIRRKMQQKDEENEAAQNYAYPEGSGSQKGQSSTAREEMEHEKAVGTSLQCGVAGNGSRSLGNMLRIIGGRPTVKGRWPWQVAVLNRYREAFCGGTLVSARWVLTAAHCVRKRLYVRIGEHDLSETDGTETELRIEQMIRHPYYDEETVDNDVALLRLREPVLAGRLHGIACLPRARQTLPTNRYCTIIGWGKRVSSDTFGTDVLHEAEVPIVSSDLCRHVYEDYHITSNMFCAGYRKGRMDSCAGDSGGPLLCKDGDRWTIFGITSFGEGCGKQGKYGIYTRLPNYVKWIQRIIKD